MAAFEPPAVRRRRAMAIGFVLLGIGLNVALLMLVLDPGRTWWNDFAAYFLAAQRMLEGASPYTAAQLGGAFEATDRTVYLYPPALAQVLGPATLMPLWLANLLWLVACFGAAYLATWIAAGIGGARRTLDRHLWSLAAVLLFPPVVTGAWQGNVSTILSLTTVLVATGGAIAGVAAAVGVLLKVVPLALVPAVLVHSRRSRAALLATAIPAVLVGIALAPGAWLELPTVLLNMTAGGVGDAHNFAPGHVAASAALPDPLPPAVLLLTVALGLGLIVASTVVARRPNGMAVAALLGAAAMLLMPGTLWYHYLALLLPFAAMAWPQASTAERSALVFGMILVSTGLLKAGIASGLLGAVIVFVAAGLAIWRMTTTTAPYHRLDDHDATAGFAGDA